MTEFDDPALSYISTGNFSVKTIKRSFSYITLPKGLPKEGTSPNLLLIQQDAVMFWRGFARKACAPKNSRCVAKNGVKATSFGKG